MLPHSSSSSSDGGSLGSSARGHLGSFERYQIQATPVRLTQKQQQQHAAVPLQEPHHQQSLRQQQQESDITELLSRLDIELKVKDGAENLLRLLQAEDGQPGSSYGSGSGAGGNDKSELKRQVEDELIHAQSKIDEIKMLIETAYPGSEAGDLPQLHPDPYDDEAAMTAPTMHSHSYSASEEAGSRYLSISPTQRMVGLPSQDSASYGRRQYENGDNGHRLSEDQRDGYSTPGGLGIIGVSETHSSFEEDDALLRQDNQAYAYGSDAEIAQVTGEEGEAEAADAQAREAARLAKVQVEALLEHLRELSEEPEEENESMAEGRPAANSPANASRRVRNVPGAHNRTPSNLHGLGRSAQRKMDTLSKLVDILRKHPRMRRELSPELIVEAVFPCLSDASGKELRAHTYRTLRSALVRPPTALCQELKRKGLHLYLQRSLLRDRRFEQEKEQAIGLIRGIMEAGCALFGQQRPEGLGASGTFVASPTKDQSFPQGGPSLEEYLDISVFHAMAALAEQQEDRMRNIVLETLTELALLDSGLLVRANCVRPLIRAMSEGGAEELAPVIMRVLLMTLDLPATRVGLQAGVDLEVSPSLIALYMFRPTLTPALQTVMSGFTDPPYPSYGTTESGLRSTARMVSVMLRSWTGLSYMCMNDLRAIRSLVESVRVNPNDASDVIMDMLYDLFNMGSSGHGEINFKRVSTTLSAATAAAIAGQANARKARGHAVGADRHNLFDHYVALVLMVFLEAGLLDALVHVIENYTDLRRKAALLIGEILHLAHKLLPTDCSQSVHTLPRLFDLAAKMNATSAARPGVAQATATGKDAASSALAMIARIDRERTTRDVSRPRNAARSKAASAMTRGPNGDARSSAADKAKQRALMQMDDTAFRNLMLDSQVLATRDHTKWNMDSLSDLLDGVLHVPRRMEEAMKSSRMAKRLLAFYHPFALRYSSIRKSRHNATFTRHACTLLRLILEQPDGARWLAEDPLVQQIAECLLQLDDSSRSSTDEPLMTKLRLDETLTGGYLEMLGAISETVEGTQLLEQFHIFTILHRLSTRAKCDYLVKLVLHHLDFSSDGQPRILLSHAISAGSRDLRLFATHRIASLLRQSANTNSVNETAVPGGEDWKIDLLLGQLYDPSLRVRRPAVRLISELCQTQSLLDRIVARRPPLDHLGAVGHSLLLRFLSTSTGLRHLAEGDYVDQNIQSWYYERNHTYCVELEVHLAQAFSLYRSAHEATGFAFDGSVPAHFYGELVKTEAGCQVLQKKGHFDDFANYIQRYGLEAADVDILTTLRSILWAVVSTSTAESLIGLLTSPALTGSHRDDRGGTALLGDIRSRLFHRRDRRTIGSGLRQRVSFCELAGARRQADPPFSLQDLLLRTWPD